MKWEYTHIEHEVIKIYLSAQLFNAVYGSFTIPKIEAIKHYRLLVANSTNVWPKIADSNQYVEQLINLLEREESGYFGYRKKFVSTSEKLGREPEH